MGVPHVRAPELGTRTSLVPSSCTRVCSAGLGPLLRDDSDSEGGAERTRSLPDYSGEDSIAPFTCRLFCFGHSDVTFSLSGYAPGVSAPMVR